MSGNPAPQPTQQEIDAFVAAARFADMAAVTAFLNKYPACIDRRSLSSHDSLNQSGPGGHTALTKAATHGQKEMVELLLKKGAQVDAPGDNRKTALLWAAHNGHPETARLLLDHKADIHASYNEGITPLIIAAWSGHSKVVELLLERGAPVDAATRAGGTALMLAACFEKIDAVRLLLEKGASMDKTDNIGRNAMTYAWNGRSADLAVLFEQWPEIRQRRREKELALARKEAEERARNPFFDAHLEKLKTKRPPRPPFKEGPG